jgi:hypothetical protein
MEAWEKGTAKESKTRIHRRVSILLNTVGSNDAGAKYSTNKAHIRTTEGNLKMS